MTVIVAFDEKRAIGKDNKLLARLPEDMKFYKEKTVGNAVVMGSRTYLSIPKRPLADRDNFVITSHPESFPEVKCFTSPEEFLPFAREYERTSGKELFVCGGAMVYRELLPYCSKAYITKISHTFEGDAFFPDIDSLDNWQIVGEGEPIETNGYTIRFVTYENKSVKEY